MSNAVEQALQTAILREIAAYELYASTAKRVEPGPSQDMLLDLAAQERGHRRRLENLLSRGAFARLTDAQEEQVIDLKITDYLVAAPLSPDASLQDILIVAGQREGNSHALYGALAQVAGDEQTRGLFEFLANEELKHKQLVEKLYDELFYAEN
ncbi:MAG: ferritin-like domain-containing protein [Anaerolineae bacterium]|jgi:rubrerythrin